MARRKETARKKNSGLEEYKANLGRDPRTGKLIRKSFYAETLSEAKEKAEEYKLLLRFGEHDKEKVGFEDWCKRWLEVYKKDLVKGSTYQFGYLNNVNKHFVPYFGNMPIGCIKQIDVQEFFLTKKDYSHHMLKKMRGHLHSIFESALENELIDRNPVRNIKLPAGKPSGEKQIYTKEQVDTVIAFAKIHKHGMGPLIVLKTGVRRGELMGLKWSDFDFKNKILHLQRSVADVIVDGKYTQVVEEGDAVTKNHVRDIPFDDELKSYLIDKKRTALALKIARQTRWAKKEGKPTPPSNVENNNDFLFMRKLDRVQSPDNYSSRHYIYFLDALTDAHPKLERLGLHELRHTFGTLLRENGVDIYTIQKVMGHSDIKMTSNIYVHNDIEVLRKAMFLS